MADETAMVAAGVDTHRDIRLKSDLGYMSPLQYRQGLGHSKTVQDYHRSPIPQKLGYQNPTGATEEP